MSDYREDFHEYLRASLRGARRNAGRRINALLADRSDLVDSYFEVGMEVLGEATEPTHVAALLALLFDGLPKTEMVQPVFQKYPELRREAIRKLRNIDPPLISAFSKEAIMTAASVYGVQTTRKTRGFLARGSEAIPLDDLAATLSK